MGGSSQMPASPQESAENFIHIQYLRAVATIIVVYFHTKVYIPQFYWPIDRLFGYSGVDIFFAISGFIMTVTTSRRSITVLRFLVKRALRIYPIYWIATIAGLTAFAFFPSYSSKENIDAVYIIASLLLIPIENEAGTSHGVPFLKTAWTLVLEILFYLIFAVTLLSSNQTWRLALVVLATTALAVFGHVAKLSSSVLLSYTSPFVLEFAMGCIAGYITMRLQKPIPKLIGFAILTVCAIALLIGAGRGDSFARVLWFGVPAALLVLVLALLEKTHGVLFCSPMLRLLGDASYSIYLFQAFCLVGFRVIADKLHLPVAQPIMGSLGILAAIVVAIAVGTLIHWWVERPFLRFARRTTRRFQRQHDRPPWGGPNSKLAQGGSAHPG